MDRLVRTALAANLVGLALLSAGCQSASHAEKGALFGGLGGAGVGALIGESVGKAGPGAALGAGIGALTGAAIGDSLDELEARNRALIEQKLQQRISPGAVSIDDVLAMVRGGVADELIVNHIRYHGMVRPLQASDLIMLQQQGVSPTVVKAMQESTAPQRETVVVEKPSRPPVVVQEHYYYDPWWTPWPWRPHPPVYYRYYGPVRHSPRVGIGLTFHN
ncbi:MAG: glycine zipper domain-containing protein [Thermoguttaceae bacterium]